MTRPAARRSRSPSRSTPRPRKVWSLVTDLPRMAAWSPQVVKTVRRAARCSAAPQFNLNRRGPLVWPTRRKVVRFEPHREFAFRIKDNATIWAFVLEPTECRHPAGARAPRGPGRHRPHLAAAAGRRARRRRSASPASCAPACSRRWRGSRPRPRPDVRGDDPGRSRQVHRVHRRQPRGRTPRRRPRPRDHDPDRVVTGAEAGWTAARWPNRGRRSASQREVRPTARRRRHRRAPPPRDRPCSELEPRAGEGERQHASWPLPGPRVVAVRAVVGAVVADDAPAARCGRPVGCAADVPVGGAALRSR